ncbi:MAG: PAS domain S-box protein [candidate division Zixibacteria bacterium]|nr:PAS domain S-box protein [candidate division Zixibacteria bacterium]
MFRSFRKRNDHEKKAIVIESDGKITFLSKPAEELLGIGKKRNILGENLFDYLHPVSHTDFRRDLEDLLKDEEQTKSGSRMIIRANDDEIEVSLTLSLKRDKEGHKIEFNFDNLKAGNQADDNSGSGRFTGQSPIIENLPIQNLSSHLTDSENKFRTMAENSLVGIYYIVDSVFEYVNPKFAQVFGYEPEEVNGKLSVKDVIYSEDWPMVRDNIKKRVAGELDSINYKFRGITKRGNVIRVEVFGSRLVQGEKVALIGTLLDVTEEERSRAVQSLMSDIGRAITNSYDLDELVQAMRPEFKKIFDINSFHVLIEDAGSSHTYAARQTNGFGDDGLFADSEAFAGLKEKLFSSGEVLSYDDHELNQVLNQGAELPDEKAGDLWLFMPLKSGGNVFGITIINFNQQRSILKKHDTDTFMLISEQISSAIERKRAENALRENEKTLSILMRDLPGMAYRCLNDDNWSMHFVSEGCRALTGYDPELLTGESQLSYENLIHPDDRSLVREAVNEGLNDDGSFQMEYRIISSDGKVRWVWEKGRAVDFLKTGPAVLEGFITDITEKKAAQEELSKSQKLLIAAIENFPAGVMIAYAPDVTLRFANSAALDIRGDSKLPLTNIHASLLPARWQTYFPDGSILFPEELPLSRAVLFGESIRDMEMIIKRDTGEERWVSVSAVPVYNDNNEIVAGVAVFPDITERKNMEDSLRAANEKLKKDQRTLHEKNVALREVLGQLDREKKIIEEQIQENIIKVVMPLVRSIQDGTRTASEEYINLLADALEEITSPFINKLQSQFSKLTPREVEICNLIKRGLSSKEIANITNVALDTIHQQRKLIRRKLGLTNTDINLTSYLNSL